MKHSGNIALVICIGLVVYIIAGKINSAEAKKIGVVQMEKLVYEFKGMKDASRNYSDKIKKWDNESDSMGTKLNELYSQVRVDSIDKNLTKLNQDLKRFELLKNSYINYVQNRQQTAEKEDKQWASPQLLPFRFTSSFVLHLIPGPSPKEKGVLHR